MFYCPKCHSEDTEPLNEQLQIYQNDETLDALELMLINMICRECSHEWEETIVTEEDNEYPHND